MDKQTLINKLRELPNKYEGDFTQSDRRSIELEGEHAICSRNWDYLDLIHDKDYLISRAKVSRKEMEEFLADVALQGSGKRVFKSVNSIDYYAGYEAPTTHEEIKSEDYEGKVQIEILITERPTLGPRIDVTYLPTLPEGARKPRIGLSDGAPFYLSE